MKLLLVSPFTSASGSAIRFWNIAEQFQKHGFSVVYSDRKSKDSKPLHEVAGISYDPSPTFNFLIFDILYSTIHNIFLLFKNLDCLVFYALKPAPNNCIAALFAKALGKKIILDIDDLDYEYFRPGIKQCVSRFFFRFFPGFFPLVTCHTPSLMTFCKKELRLPEDRIYYLAQGVSQEFLKIDVSSKPAVPQKSILYVATLGITSDFDELLPMLAKVCVVHKDAVISVVGDGVRRPLFEATAANLGISAQVTFIGRISHSELPEVMARHAIGLNYMRPSFVNNCRAILKIREYLACGLQVVCNNTGDAELFKEFSYIEPDIDSMKKKLLDLLAARAEINKSGRAFIETDYSWEKIIDAFVLLLKKKSILSR